jgi:predicted permease
MTGRLALGRKRLGWVEDLLRDVRYGMRMFGRTPGFTAVAVLSLALGIGANTAIFTIFDAILLEPLPVDRPHDLRTTNLEWRLNGFPTKSNNTVPYQFYEALRREPAVFSEVLAFIPPSDVMETTVTTVTTVTDGTRTLHAPGGGLFVSSNYFRLLGVTAQIGRLFDPQADAAAADHIVVLADAFWRRHFDGEAAILGKAIAINGVMFTVIGVAPAGFFGLTIGRVPDVFLPLHDIAAAQPGVIALADPRNWIVQIAGRLRPGVNDAMATERLTVLRFANERTPQGVEMVLQTVPIDTGLAGVRTRFMRPLTILMVMVAVLLVIACANVATMLLSRAAARKTEIVVRSAMGAGRARLLRQLAAESALLVSVAAVLGVVFSAWTTRTLLALMQSMDPSLALDLAVDRRSLLFTTAVSSLAAVLAGLSPARHAIRVHAGSVLKERCETGGGSSGGRLGYPVVAVQVALSLALVVTAVLLARTLYGLATVDAGFRPECVVLATVYPSERGYKDAALRTYFQDVHARLRGAPGVAAATLAQFSFLTEARTTGTFAPRGFTPSSEEERQIQVYQVGPQFFSTMGMPIIEGRDFTDEDMVARTPKAIALNETAARRYFGNENPVGRMVGDTDRVIAVVRNARYNTLRDENVAVMFTPYLFANRGRMTFAVRLTSDSTGGHAVLTRIRELDALVPVQVTTLQNRISHSLGQERLLAIIAAFFGGTALLLLSLGLYGVMSFGISERTPEIGIRLALGGQRAQVVWSVLRRPALFVMVGIASGIGLILAGGRFISAFLYGLAPQDPATIAGAAGLLCLVAAAAGAVPARRAASVDPVIALRCE